MKYSAEDCKLIKIILETNQTFFANKRIIKVEVPLDFVPNNRWYRDQIRKYHIAECEKWLKKEGFVKDDNGKFSIYHGMSSKRVRLPGFFMINLKKIFMLDLIT